MSREVDQLLKQLRFPPEGNGERRVAMAIPTRMRAPFSRPMVGAAREPRFGAWPWVLLALILGASLPFWPYPHHCGLPLYGYLAADGVFLLVAVKAMAGAWTARQGLGHVLGLAAFLWGLALAGLEILPRVGYALEAASWRCPAL